MIALFGTIAAVMFALPSFGIDDARISYRVLATFPFFMAMWIYLEHPPPGRGVGKTAGPLPALKFLPVGVSAKVPPVALPPLGKHGELKEGHAYMIVFFNTAKACIRTLPKVDTIARRVRAAGAADWFHVLLVSREEHKELSNFSSRWKDRSVPMAHDGNAQASVNYMGEHSAYVVPHAFVVDRSHKITWHGHINRPQCGSSCAAILKEAGIGSAAVGGTAAPAAAGKGASPGATASPSSGKGESTETPEAKKDK